MNYIKDDLVSVINAVIDRRIQGLVTYRGIVQKISNSGYVFVSSNELNISESDSESYLLVGSGINSYNFITPDIGEEIEFYFPKGENSQARYINIIRKEPPINEKDKYFVKYKDFLIYNDTINGSLRIKSRDSEIEIEESGNITIDSATQIKLNSVTKIILNATTGIEIESNAGIIPLEKSILGESLKAELDLVKNMLTELQSQIAAWVPVPLDGGSALKGNLAVFQSMELPDFSDILSNGTKNN